MCYKLDKQGKEFEMTMMLNVDDKYIDKLESFIASLPQDTVEVKELPSTEGDRSKICVNRVK